MKKLSIAFQFIVLISALFVSCKKEEVLKLESHIIFSVDLGGVLQVNDVKSFIAAFTSEGILLGYGSLSDSTKWELKSDFNGNMIDIVYYDVYTNNGSLNIHHFKNLKTGQLFSKIKELEPPKLISLNVIPIVLKVEDFGNRIGSNTGTITYEQWPHKHVRGWSYPYGEFLWDKIKDGYTQVNTNIDLSSESQGFELILFEKGTNIPYVNYVEFNSSNIKSGDTVVLRKSDFKIAELKTIRIKASNNKISSKLLYTYNSIENKRDIITSFEYIPESAPEEIIRYVKSSALPISSWKFSCSYTSAQSTYRMSYFIGTNTGIPEFIGINDLSGMNIIKSGNQFNFTHGNIFSDKKLSNSTLSFYKRLDYSSFYYNLYFNEIESVGNITVIPFDIPKKILDLKEEFIVLNNNEWLLSNYSQTYSYLPGYSPSELLHKMVIRNIDGPLNSDYFYEKFSNSLH